MTIEGLALLLMAIAAAGAVIGILVMRREEARYRELHVGDTQSRTSAPNANRE